MMAQARMTDLTDILVVLDSATQWQAKLLLLQLEE